MVDRVKVLSGGNMNIDFVSDDINWKQNQCHWNVEDKEININVR
ncbi:hypothetical protein [Clostridium sulfidigenes]